MERDFYNDEFEELIRQKTDQYKMYPSEQVWKRIYNSLHTGRRRFIGGMSVLITGILLIAGKELLMPGAPSGNIKKNTAIPASSKPTDTAAEQVVSQLKVPTTSRQQSGVSDYKYADEGNNTSQPLPVPIALAYAGNLENKPNGTTAAFSADKVAAGILGNSDDINGTQRSLIISSPVAAGELEKQPIPENLADSKPLSTKEIAPAADKQKNWLQQYAAYELKEPIKRNRISWTIYASPSVNYRMLSGGDPYSVPKPGAQYVPIALTHFGNPEDYVNHRPVVGYEAGGSILYRLTRNLTLKTGLQFNYIRYNIQAYESSSTQQATIALNSFYGTPTNTITGYTNIQNFGGNSTKNLFNKYYELSAPVGLELRVIGSGRLQFNVAANVQPTYLLNRNSYLLTTDYSDYTKAPSLFRRWNFNAGLEAFVSYKIGGLRWQIGPELRYQLLSTYIDRYPIKENLKQYGLKIGVSKTIW